MREGKNMGIMTTFKKPTLESTSPGGMQGPGAPFVPFIAQIAGKGKREVHK